MFRSRLTVTVPKPCHEDWQAMTPVKQGRFCNSCQKTVVDFTAMSDAEVVKWLEKQNGETCGKFLDSQLTRTLTISTSFSNKWAFKALALGIFTFLTAKSASAQEWPKPAKQDIETLPTYTFKASLATSVPNSQNVSGIVLAQAPGEKIVINIRLNDSIETQADAEGRFVIPIPKAIPKEEQWLVISAIGFQTQRHRLSDILQRQPIQIALASENLNLQLQGRLGGAIVTYKWHSFYGMKQRLRNLFR